MRTDYQNIVVLEQDEEFRTRLVEIISGMDAGIKNFIVSSFEELETTLAKNRIHLVFANICEMEESIEVIKLLKARPRSVPLVAIIDTDREVCNPRVLRKNADFFLAKGSGKALEFFVEKIFDIESDLPSKVDSLREIQKITHTGNWVWDIKTGEIFWSDEIYRIFGLMPQEFTPTYEKFLETIHPDDVKKVTEAVDKAVTSKHPYSVEHRVVRPDKRIRHVHEKGVLYYDDEGNPLHMLGVVRDVSAMKIAENELKRYRSELETLVFERTSALKESEQKHKTVLETIIDCVIVIDSKGAIESFNIASEKLFGYKQDEVLGKNVNILMPDPFKSEHDGYIRRYLISGSPSESTVIGRGREIVGLKKNGDIFPIHLSVTKMVIHDEPKFTGVIRDITEEKRFQSELLEAKILAERANSAKSDFLSQVNHELRTPLNAILGFAQLFELSDNLDEEQVDALLEIKSASKHLLSLIKDVLDLSKIESGNIDTKIGPFVANEVVHECVALASSHVKQNQIEVNLSCEEKIEVTSDREKLKQIVLNLISNAAKYNVVGGKIFIELTANKTEVSIIVRDTGVGIPEDKQKILFTPFSRLGAEKGSIEGTGIGLHISQKLAQLINGKISYQSPADGGSEFRVVFPKVHQDAGQSLDDQLESVNEFVSPRNFSRVLYVEDNERSRMVMNQIFDKLDNIEGYYVEHPDMGVALLEEMDFDLILLDINLPGKTGYELCQEIRQMEQYASVPCFALTANATEECKRQVKESGFDEFVTKPVDFKLLTQKIRLYLDREEHEGK